MQPKLDHPAIRTALFLFLIAIFAPFFLLCMTGCFLLVKWLISIPSIHQIKAILLNWQSLIAGTFAILAALLGAWMVWGQILVQREQIKLQKEIAKSEQDRVKKSTKIATSLYISKIFTYIGHNLDSLISIGSALSSRQMHPPHANLLDYAKIKSTEFPLDTVTALQQLAGFLDSDEYIQVFNFFVCAQITDSRLNTYFSELRNETRTPTHYENNGYIVDLAELKLRAEKILEYSRGSDRKLEAVNFSEISRQFVIKLDDNNAPNISIRFERFVPIVDQVNRVYQSRTTA
jgi:hypothetical protein